MSDETYAFIIAIIYALVVFTFIILFSVYKTKYEAIKEQCKEYINIKEENDKNIQLAVDFEKVNREIENYKVIGGYKK